MRRYFTLLLVLAVLITAGCIEPDAATTTVTTEQTPVTSAVPTTPGQTPAPAPAEMAYLTAIHCSLDQTTERSYHCNGNVRIRSGSSGEVRVVARYPDKNTFYSNVVELGGDNALSKPFVLFPDLKYQGQTPDYFVHLNNTLYPVIWSGDAGTAWANLPQP